MYRTNYDLNKLKNMVHKIVFFQKAHGALFELNQFCPTYFARVFWSDLDISDK